MACDMKRLELVEILLAKRAVRRRTFERIHLSYESGRPSTNNGGKLDLDSRESGGNGWRRAEPGP
jgi:hypothetical protein